MWQTIFLGPCRVEAFHLFKKFLPLAACGGPRYSVDEAGIVKCLVETRCTVSARMQVADKMAASLAAPFCGEALISGTTISKRDVVQTARAWMTKTKATGAVAELAADGTTTVAWLRDGSTVKDAKETGLGSLDQTALQDAAKRFLPQKAFLALGAGDLLAPGKWQPGSYSGEASDGTGDHRAKKRHHADAVLERSAEPQPLKQASSLPTVLGTNLRYKGPLHENDGGIVSLGLIPPVPDSVWARELRNNLKGKSLIYLYGDAWVHGAEVRGYTCSNLDVALLSEVLGDAPAGTAIVVGHGADLCGAWRIS